MIGNQIKKSRQERGRRAKKDREGKEMGTGEWEMPAGRKRAREAGVQKREQKAKKWGQEGGKCPPAGREQERGRRAKKEREGKEAGQRE